MTINLNKSKVFTNLTKEKHALYNYIVNVLLGRIMSRRFIHNKSVTLVASKRETNKFLNKIFHDYIWRQLKNDHGIEIKIEIKTPSEEKCLQAVDVLSWSIFRKYEFGDATYYNLLKPSIVEEYVMYK